MAYVVCGVVRGGPRARCELCEVRTARQGNLAGSPIGGACAYGKTRARSRGRKNKRLPQRIFSALRRAAALRPRGFAGGILVESGLFWWGEMGFARREDPRKNEKHGQARRGRGRGRVVPILSHVSQSSQESQVTVKHGFLLEQSNTGASL